MKEIVFIIIVFMISYLLLCNVYVMHLQYTLVNGVCKWHNYLSILPFFLISFYLSSSLCAADTKVNHVRSSGTIQIRTSGSQGDPTSVGKNDL